jgi:hypothetical protein
MKSGAFRLSIGLLIVSALTVSGPGFAARTDGDPASDFLVTQDVFLGFEPISKSAAEALTRAVSDVFSAGNRIKVAVVVSRSDLGSIPSLFNKPAEYSKFLGTELGGAYAGPLLIVMARGFGIYDLGRSTAQERRVLSKVRLGGTTAAALARSATVAVQQMSAAHALRSKDIRAPSVYPQFTTVAPGQTFTFTYRILEDSERSKDSVTFYDGTVALAVMRHRLTVATFSTARSVQWTAPDPLPSNLRVCIVATDPSGNASQPSCLPLRAKQARRQS